jgi:DNA-binding NarL/FixJ family response regulator
MIRIAVYGAPVQASGLEAALRSNLISLAGREKPEIILVDATGGFTSNMLRELQRKAPEAKIVLWVDTISPVAAMEAMMMGVRGILRKSLPTDLQVSCLRKVQAGEVWFERAVAAPPATSGATLTTREQSVMDLVLQGMKDGEIAMCLAVTEAEVKAHLRRLYQKLDVKDRFELALLGLKKSGWRPGGAAREFQSTGFGDALESATRPLVPTLQ